VVWRRKTLLTGGFAVQPGKTELVRLKLTRAGTQHLHQEPKPHRMRVTFVIRQKGLGNQNVAGQLRCNERAP
jgi:hypothetical protein